MKIHPNPETHKLHMVTLNGRTKFIWYPKGTRPSVEINLIERFGLRIGDCIMVG